MKWGPFGDFFSRKVSQCRKKLKGRLGFFNIRSVVKHQKIEGDPLGNFFRKKPQCQKLKEGTI